MNKKFLVLTGLSLASLATLPHTVYAEEQEKPLSAEVEFGWLSTGGNTDTTSTKTVLDVKQNTEKWRHNYIFEGYGSQTDSETTSEKYAASMRNVFRLNKKHSGLFIFSSYEVDRFSGYDYQASLSLGYSNRLFSNAQSHLDYNIGPGYSFTQAPVEDNLGNEIDTVKDESFIVRADLSYVYRISETAKFEQKVSTDYATDSDKNTKTKSVTSLSANINNSLAMKASFTLTYNDTPPEDDLEHADTQSSITLVYSF